MAIMNARKRPKDIIEAIEAIAGEGGQFEPVDEDYYQAFVDLTRPQIAKLAIAILLDQEMEVRRLLGGRINLDAPSVKRRRCSAEA